MKIIRKISIVLFFIVLSFSVMACNRSNNSKNTGTPSDTNNPGGTQNPGGGNLPDGSDIDLSFDYYAKSALRSDKKIYVLNSQKGTEQLGNDEFFLAQAIQGLFARQEVTFYVDGRYMTNGVNIDQYYLDSCADKYGLVVEYITLNEALQMYLDSWDKNISNGLWGSKIPLSDFNTVKGVTAYTETSGDGFNTPGFIVYRKGEVSVNVAATLCGLTGFLPVEYGLVDKYKGLGLTEKFNVDSIALGYNWLFNVALSEINPDGLVHQNYTAGGGETNKFIKDYGICNKYMYVYYDSITSASNKFKTNLHNFLTPNRPIFGYTFSEDSDVAFFSQFGQFIVPTDYTCNLTFFSAKQFDGIEKFKQPNSEAEIKAEQKHYTAFVVSDGDNATYWQNTAPFSTNYMNAVGRNNDNFSITWSISPSLADLMPPVLDTVYNNVSNEHDYFCAPVSGHGYINAGSFALQNNGDNFKDYLEKLNVYMTKSGLSTVTIIGGSMGGNINKVLEGYAGEDAVKGGIVYEGNKYFGSVKGGVQWVNGKPFVGCRDSLWETTPEYIAARINMYEVDPTSINGYSIINVHPWSHSYEDVRTIVNMLNDNVEVVSVDTIMRLMTENIKDKSNTTSFNIPEKNGVSISESYLQSQPSLIPVNPLFNDFLLWEEDWSGSGLTYANSDEAMSNVGAIYKGSIQIANGTTATKKEFTLPNVDDLWISFSARAKASSVSLTSTFKYELTVDGVTKTIIDSAVLKGVSGTGTSKVIGDGWQKFAFPISQYFPDYKNKTAQMSITVLDGVALKIDQVCITNRSLNNEMKYDPYNNNFENKNTEDWMLGEQYKTSQYYHFGAYDRNTLNETGTIQIDCSDGGGDEKRNGNTNVWIAKTYQLPESGKISVSYRMFGGGDAGAMAKVSLYVDGHYLVLSDWVRYVDASVHNINLTDTFSEIDFNDKIVTVVIEVRDCGLNNGVGESLDFDYFYTKSE